MSREAMQMALDALESIVKEMRVTPAVQGREYVGLGIQANNAIAALRAALAEQPAAMTESKETRNARVQDRYDELMREGKHGHYETLFRIVREELVRATLADQPAAKRVTTVNRPPLEFDFGEQPAATSILAQKPLEEPFRSILADNAEALYIRDGQPAAPQLDKEWTPCVKLPIVVYVREQRPGEKHISTREGITPVKPDDLIMRGIAGEEYPIGRELFERTYRISDKVAALAEPAAPVLTDEDIVRIAKEVRVPINTGKTAIRLVRATLAAAIPPGCVAVPVEKLELLRFIQRVLEGDAPQADRNAAAQMVRDLRKGVAARPGEPK